MSFSHLPFPLLQKLQRTVKETTSTHPWVCVSYALSGGSLGRKRTLQWRDEIGQGFCIGKGSILSCSSILLGVLKAEQGISLQNHHAGGPTAEPLVWHHTVCLLLLGTKQFNFPLQREVLPVLLEGRTLTAADWLTKGFLFWGFEININRCDGKWVVSLIPEACYDGNTCKTWVNESGLKCSYKQEWCAGKYEGGKNYKIIEGWKGKYHDLYEEEKSWGKYQDN